MIIIWEPAIETWAQEMNGAREQTGGPESWTVPPTWKLYFNPCTVLYLLQTAVACNGAVVAMKTTQVAFNPYQTFQMQNFDPQLNAKTLYEKSSVTGLF